MTDSVIHRLAALANDNVDLREPEALDDLGVFGWLRGVRDRAVMLELRKRGGDIMALGYAWLDKVEFIPSQGMILSFGGHRITIRGRHLNGELRPNVRLFQGICRHRVPWIQEADEVKLMEAETNQTIVEEIEW